MSDDFDDLVSKLGELSDAENLTGTAAARRWLSTIKELCRDHRHFSTLILYLIHAGDD